MALLSAVLGSGPACSAEAEWRRVAEQATWLAPGQLDRAAAAVEKLPRERRAAVEQALGALAAVPGGQAGLAEAERTLSEAVVGLGSSSAVDGTDPAVAALRGAALCVFQGLILRTAKEIAATGDVAQATELVRWTRALTVFEKGDVATLREEAQTGLGPLYTEALRKLAAP